MHFSVEMTNEIQVHQTIVLSTSHSPKYIELNQKQNDVSDA